MRPLTVHLLVLAALLAAGRASAQAPTATCVEVITPRPDAGGLLRLVRDEVDRHGSHRVVDGDCQAWLRVELIEVKEGRFLTARVGSSVPHREHIEDTSARALSKALERAITVVLHNDPTRLYGPERDTWFHRNAGALRREGRNLFGAEMYGASAYVDGQVDSLPGINLVARREVEAWHLGFRAGAAWHPGDVIDRQAHLTMLATGAVEVVWFTDALADKSWYLGGQAGLEVQRFTGPATFLEEGTNGAVNKVLMSLGARAGAELFRTTDTRMNLFALISLPVKPSTDKDQGVIDQWVPSLSLGAGVVF